MQCNNIETDSKKLRWKLNVGAAILLCCAICPKWHPVETTIQPVTDLVASPPAMASSLVINQSALITDVPLLLTVEDASTHIIDAADEQMSQGPEDIPLSDSGTLVDVSQARDEPDQTAEQQPEQPLIDQLEIPMHSADDVDLPLTNAPQVTAAAEPSRLPTPG